MSEIERLRDENTRLRKALRMGLEIHDEYLRQIAHCTSQDYARLNQFPIDCRKLGIVINEPR